MGRGRRQLAFGDVHRACSRVVVKGRFSGKNKSGAVLDTGFEHMFDMRDGKVVHFENKPGDTAAWASGLTG